MGFWEKISTKKKYRIAQIVYGMVKTARFGVGMSDLARVNRHGIRYELDLSEAIDLALYFDMYERSSHKTMFRFLKKGDTVFDIGANLGVYTMYMARCVGSSGKVFAFEPTTYAYRKLRRNVELNPQLEGIVSLNNAYLNESNHAIQPNRFFASWNLRNGHRKHSIHCGELKEANGAESKTLDEFVQSVGIEQIDFMKIDVDGFECRILRGGVRVLSEFRPVILCEICPYALKEMGDSLQCLIDLLKKFDYYVFNERTGQRIEMTVGSITSLIPKGGAVNVLLTPNSKGTYETTRST